MQSGTISFYILTSMVLDALDEVFGKIWINDGATIYADDQWAAWLVRNREELQQALQGIETVIRVLGNFGLAENAAKSAVLYQFKGNDVHKELKKYLLKRDGQKSCNSKGPEGTVHVPVRTSHEYLGTIFSYREAENLALQHRLKKS